MTYNFDPDAWRDMEIRHLERLRRSEKITETEFRQNLEALDRRHGDMWDQLDGTYQIP